VGAGCGRIARPVLPGGRGGDSPSLPDLAPSLMLPGALSNGVIGLDVSIFNSIERAPRRSRIRPEGGIPSPARPSQPPGIESCVVQGNDHHEA